MEVFGQGDGYKSVSAPVLSIGKVAEFINTKPAHPDAVHIAELRAFAIMNAPPGEEAVRKFTDEARNTTKRAWITSSLLIADATGSIEVSADAAVVHALYNTETIADLEDGAVCVPLTHLWHGRLMVKALPRLPLPVGELR